MLNYDLLKNKGVITILGHKNTDVDSMTSCYLMEKLLNFHGIETEILMQDGILDPLYDFKSYPFKYKTKLSSKDILFLVDHLDLYENEIVGCVDHHPSNLTLDSNYIYKQQTSCAKIIADEMISCGMELTKEDIYLIVYSQYMDSLSFKSSKALKEDKIWCKEQIDKYGFNEDFLYESGLCLNDISVINYDAISYGLKEYKIGPYNVAASYITQKTEPIEKSDEFISEIVKNLGKYDYWFFIINCIEEDTTVTYLINKNLVEIDKYRSILSRGKTLIPMLEKRLSNENVTEKLISKNLTISTMESCTSGLIASTITDTEGASQILKGSAITYSNECKILEGVDTSVIDDYGVYSPETACEMSAAAKLKYLSNISIGITGSAGRVDPNNKDSVSGIIYYCIHYAMPVYMKKPSFTYQCKIKFLKTDYTRKEMKEIIVDKVLKKLNSVI